MKSLLLVAAMLAITTQSHAVPSVGDLAQAVNDDVNSAAYEKFRKAKADNAPNLEAFLEWATPEEIASDLGIDPNEAPAEMVSDKNYNVRITVDISSQTMEMFGAGVGGDGILRDRVATARKGFSTPVGCHEPTSIERNHWSRKYKAPMPYSVFFVGGVALHQGSVNVKSHGCVHLNTSTAAKVYKTALANRGSTLICVQR
jgi:lipoprotein-anchoring transpeptidase ErfK/SrfK